MIDAIDQRLKDWVVSAVGSVDVSLAMPTGRDRWAGVSLYLVDVTLKPAIHSSGASARHIALRYLVTAWSDQPEDAHRLLGDLVFAAMDSADFEVEPSGASTELWQALGTPPRPSFMLVVPLKKPRVVPDAPLVRLPVVVEAAPVESFHGLVLGPGDIPLAGATVRLESLNLEARTDSAGRFLFHSIPGGSRPKSFIARAKGLQTSVTTSAQHPAASHPFVLRFDNLED